LFPFLSYFLAGLRVENDAGGNCVVGDFIMARSEMSDIREIRKYAGQVQRVASALADDKDFARRLIDAVHSGRSAEVESVFTELDVGSDVRISTVDETGSGSATPKTRARAATKPKMKTITVTIGIGSFSISVTVKKESK
jgi:hypothetical protein